MAQKSKGVWNKDLEDFVEKRERNNFGFCMLDGVPNTNPERVGVAFVCYNCRRERLEDCLILSKSIKQWLNLKN